LKLSGNYAEVGNGGRPQLRFNTYTYAQGAGHGFIFRDPTKAIPDLKPEIVKTLNLASTQSSWKTVWDFSLQFIRAIQLTIVKG
jgi:hypothetical protein